MCKIIEKSVFYVSRIFHINILKMYLGFKKKANDNNTTTHKYDT